MVFDTLRELIAIDRDRPAIVVNDLSETFRLYHERPTGLKERLYHFRKSRFTEFYALEDVSFSVAHGESVGVVGHNGSGKSTLLKVLARILPPDADGKVEINGRVASLLELGAGFHGDLSGRENIYLNGAILGLTRAEIDRRFDDIVDFAGVRQFLDTPVRNYSSGMYVRLGFAIAVHVDPDILLVDEVLSVGDASFQARSLERMREFRRADKTVVLVTHDLNAIQQLCERVLVLNRGRLVYDGPTRNALQVYAQLMAAGDTTLDVNEIVDLGDHVTTGSVRVEDVALFDFDGVPAHRVAPSSQLMLRIRVRALHDVRACSVGVAFHAPDGTLVYEIHTTWQGLGVGPLRTGQVATVEIRFTAHVLSGVYTISPQITDPTGHVPYDIARDALRFEVQPAPGGAGLADFVASTAVVEGPSLALGVVPEATEDADDTPPFGLVSAEDGGEPRAAATG